MTLSKLRLRRRVAQFIGCALMSQDDRRVNRASRRLVRQYEVSVISEFARGQIDFAISIAAVNIAANVMVARARLAAARRDAEAWK